MGATIHQGVHQSVHQSLLDVLLELELHLREQSLWTNGVPDASRLCSVEPFCIDTLNFPEWLQFVFLPRMSVMLEAQMPLPEKSAIAPMAEEYFRSRVLDGGARICKVLRRFDQLIERVASE